MAFKKYKMSTAGLITTIAVIVLGIVDLVLVVLKGEQSSISTFLINSSQHSVVFTFAIGFVCGHLFGPMKPEKST